MAPIQKSGLPGSSQDILSLAETVTQAAADHCSARFDPQTRFKLLAAIKDLQHAVETPTDTVLRLIYQPPQNASLRIAVELNVFSILTERAQEEKPGISAAELAGRTGADKTLIVRLMRVMTALGLCASSESEVYHANEKTAVMTQPIGKDGIRCIYDLTVPTLAKLPEYLRVHNYANPQDYAKSPMQWAVGVSQFEWLAQDQRKQALFNSYMSSRREGKPSWFEAYPMERVLDGAIMHEDAVLLVDVGGNHGHDLQRFYNRYPDAPGRLILQDLPSVVSSGPRLKGIEAMGYSFFSPQPVKGARAYTFRAIFHDWPDHICRTILRNTASAMAPGYSKIIIIDFVLPDVGTPLMQASMDIQMMSIGAGVERSESQWRELLDSAGLEITGIWSTGPGMEAIIEAIPAHSEV